MRDCVRGSAIVLVVVLTLALAGIARGEPFVDVGIGGALTDNARVNVRSGSGSAAGEVDFDTSFESGVRGGYWFDELPWLGLGGSMSYFAPDAPVPGLTRFDRADVSEVPFTALLMLRGTLLESRQFPYGQVQPYLNVGPGAFVTRIHDHDSHLTATDADVGVDARAGAYVLITPRIGVFGEYRFTHTDVGVSDDHVRNIGRVDIDSTLDTHHFLFGASLRF